MFACIADRKFTKTVEALLEHPDIDVNVRNPVWHLLLTYIMHFIFDLSLPCSSLLPTHPLSRPLATLHSCMRHLKTIHAQCLPSCGIPILTLTCVAKRYQRWYYIYTNHPKMIHKWMSNVFLFVFNRTTWRRSWLHQIALVSSHSVPCWNTPKSTFI